MDEKELAEMNPPGQGHHASRQPLSLRVKVLAVAVSLTGAVAAWHFGRGVDLGWGTYAWDVFWTITFGWCFGAITGQVALTRVRQDSRPILGGFAGAALMTAIWLVSGEKVAVILGSLSRAAFGAYFGFGFVLLAEYD